jgi:hypothetical protein
VADGFGGNTASIEHQQLGDAEVQEFRRPFFIHENVAGLQIAMHNEIAMGIFDCIEDLEKEPETLLYG